MLHWSSGRAILRSKCQRQFCLIVLSGRQFNQTDATTSHVPQTTPTAQTFTNLEAWKQKNWWHKTNSTNQILSSPRTQIQIRSPRAKLKLYEADNVVETESVHTHRNHWIQIDTQTLYTQTRYTQTLLHTDLFTSRHLYVQMLLHTDTCTRRCFYTLTHRHSYTKSLPHTDAFTRNPFMTQMLLHTDAFFTHRRVYTQTLFTPVFDDQTSFRAKGVFLHTDAFTHRHFLPKFLTIRPRFVRKGCAGRLKIAIFL